MNPMSRRKRQFILFLTAVVLPASLLIAFAFRFLRQEEELAKQRGEVERSGTIEGVRRELTAKLDAIKLEEVNRRIRESSADDLRPSPAIVFVVPWNSAGLVLPLDPPRRPGFSSGQFVTLMDSGESLEFQAKNLSGAAELYRKAMSVAHQPAETCEARLRMGRALAGAGKLPDARRVYLDMLMNCGSIADDSGMPFNFYAADRLIELQLDVPRATEYVLHEIDSVRLRPLPEASML